MTLSRMEDERADEAGREEARKLGARIRQLRVARGWTQEQLAEHAGVHYKYLGDVERGVRNPALFNIARIARALGVPVAVLFMDEREVV